MTKTQRLGDLLVAAGLVSRLEIDHALQAQQIFGGRLGTNLIEMEAIDPETLASFLSQQFGVPRVTIDEFERIPPAVLAVVPAKAAQRLAIVPISKEGEKVQLAMMDPSEGRVLERIEKNLGLKVDPRVATEIEIRYYLEKYYGIQRESRHIQLMNQVLAQKRSKAAADANQTFLHQLDEQVSREEAVSYFFGHMQNLSAIPTRKQGVDVTKFTLTPESMFLLQQADGLSSVNDILNVSPLPRLTTLRTLTYLSKLGLISFQLVDDSGGSK